MTAITRRNALVGAGAAVAVAGVPGPSRAKMMPYWPRLPGSTISMMRGAIFTKRP